MFENMSARHGKLLFAGAVLLFFGFIAVGDAAAESAVKITSGYEYSSGDYGQDVTTEIEYIPVSMEYILDAWSAKLTVPYIRVTGNGTVVPGTGSLNGSKDFGKGGFVGSSSSTTTTTNSGLGDVVASVAYAFFPKQAIVPFIEMRAKVKFGTADADKALGTGENDYSFQVDGVLGDGSLQPFYTMGYVLVGDTSTIDYDDRFFATAGLMYKLNTMNVIGLTYDYQQASLDGVDDMGVAGAFFTSKFSPGWSATLNMSLGLTDSSLDHGGSLMLGYEF